MQNSIYDVSVPLTLDELTFLIVTLDTVKVLENDTGNLIFNRLKDIKTIFVKSNEIQELSNKINQINKKESE